jgi:hypothetical protein
VDVDAHQPGVLPAAAVVHKEADVLGRARLTKVTSISGRQLKGHRSLQSVRGRVEAYAGEFFECSIAKDFDFGLELALGEIAEVIGVLEQQLLEVAT